MEFAVRLPAQDEGVIYLPVDSKFPGDVYAALVSAYEQGSKEAVQEAAKVLLVFRYRQVAGKDRERIDQDIIMSFERNSFLRRR